MPTLRTFWFLVAGFTLYLFANQTQVGWLYVMSAILIGLVVVGFLLNRTMTKGLRVERVIGSGLETELYEGDEIGIQLHIHNPTRSNVYQLSGSENCPLVASDHEMRNMPIFIPSIKGHGSITLDYDITLNRRGVYEFADLAFQSDTPFGFFRKKAILHCPTRVLVYPEVKSLDYLSLFDRKLAAQLTYPRAGIGSEVIGIRPYRTGDSPRHIHWRSVAKSGQLISKEFAEETQRGLTLVIDRYCPPEYPYDSKHTPFEYAVKASVSIAEYAQKRGYPLHLVADATDLPPPSGAVSWDAFLQYMARITPRDIPTVDRLLHKQNFQTLVAVVLSAPNPAVIESLLSLQHGGLAVLAVVMDAESFPNIHISTRAFYDDLLQAGIDTRLISFGDDWTNQLTQHPNSVGSTHVVDR